MLSICEYIRFVFEFRADGSKYIVDHFRYYIHIIINKLAVFDLIYFTHQMPMDRPI